VGESPPRLAPPASCRNERFFVFYLLFIMRMRTIKIMGWTEVTPAKTAWKITSDWL